MPKMTMVQAINLALAQEMAGDDRVIVLGEDVGVSGGVFRVTEGLYERFGAERVIDTPLAESAIVGMSIGMAVYGLRPVCEMQFSGFAYHAFHQIEAHASGCAGVHRGDITCPWWCVPRMAGACEPWSTTPRAARYSGRTCRA